MHATKHLMTGIIAAVLAVGPAGCGGSKSDAPAHFSTNPTEQPIDPGKGGKPAAGKQKDRGPGTTTGDS
jgi:hypothetical protein